MIKKKTESKVWRDKCDKLYSEIIKVRANYTSELSGKVGLQRGGDYILHTHHIFQKPNFALRYDLANGICLTAGEHKFIAHGNHKQQKRIYKIVEDRLDYLETLENKTMKANYKEKFEELSKILKELKEK